MGFNSAFKGLKLQATREHTLVPVDETLVPLQRLEV